MAAVKYEVEVQGMRELVARLNPDKLLSRAIKKAMSEVGKEGRAQAKAIAPRDTGRLAGSITYKLSRPLPLTDIPRGVAVVVKALSPRGYYYPRRLEFDPRSRHRNWFMGAMESARGKFEGMLRSAASDIERRFGGGR